LNEKPNQDTLNELPEGSAIEDIREGFEEIYGNMEGFSKRAVGSLFDDDKNSDKRDRYDRSVTKDDLQDDDPKPIRLGRHGSPSRLSGPYTREADPDEDYARYIRTAEKANRMEQERLRVNKERAIMARDEKLGEAARSPKRRMEPEMRPRETKPEMRPIEIKPVTRIRATEEADLYTPERGRRRINVRNLAALGAFLALIVCAVLTWQMLAAQSELAAANERIGELTNIETEFESLRIENDGLASEVTRLQDENNQMYEDILFWQGMVGSAATGDGVAGGYDEGGDEHAAAPETSSGPTTGDLPYTTINAQGNRVYTMLPNDTLWSIAVRIYGDGSRFTDILAANNLTEAQAGVLPAGTVLIIPN